MFKRSDLRCMEVEAKGPGNREPQGNPDKTDHGVTKRGKRASPEKGIIFCQSLKPVCPKH
jgi:hypothetical protein